MNTGANIEFIVTEIASATRNLARQKSPFINVEAYSRPIYSKKMGVPFEKNNHSHIDTHTQYPQITMRGIIPKVLL